MPVKPGEMPVRKTFLVCALAAVLGLLPAGRVGAQNFNTWPVTSAAAGNNQALFIKSDGSLWGMGENTYGELGLGSTITNSLLPQKILSNGVAAVVCGQYHSVIINGTSVWAMGQNLYGQLGDGSTNNHYIPEQIFAGGFLRARSIAAGTGHSLFAIANAGNTSGALEGMGDNHAGDLGITNTIEQLSPVASISTNRAAVNAISAGSGFSVFVKPDGSLWGMGTNTYGALGSIFATSTPIMLVASNVTAVSAGYGYIVYIRSDSTLWGMGDNSGGQLSQCDGQYLNEHSPTPLVFFDNGGFPNSYVTNVVAVATGTAHCAFVRSDGSLWAVGDNTFGQLGFGGDNYYTDTPRMVVASNVVGVAAGFLNTFFIKSDGSLWAMGDNRHGQLGTGDTVERDTPVEIVSPPPRLSILPYGGNVVLAWTTNAAAFVLQSTTNLAPPNWTNFSPGPITIGNQYEVINAATGGPLFFRLTLNQ